MHTLNSILKDENITCQKASFRVENSRPSGFVRVNSHEHRIFDHRYTPGRTNRKHSGLYFHRLYFLSLKKPSLVTLVTTSHFVDSATDEDLLRAYLAGYALIWRERTCLSLFGLAATCVPLLPFVRMEGF